MEKFFPGPLTIILKKKDMPLLQKEMNKTGLLFLGLCLMILTFGFTGDIIGLTKYNSFFGIAYIVFCIAAIIILALIDRKSTFNFQSPLNNKMTPLIEKVTNTVDLPEDVLVTPVRLLP